MSPFIEVTDWKTSNLRIVMVAKIVTVLKQGDMCVINTDGADDPTILPADSYEEVRAKIVQAYQDLTDAPAIIDADKICQALDEVTRELRNVNETLLYKLGN